MIQTGKVIKIEDDIAIVEVRRSSACESCHAGSCLTCGKLIEARALNEAGATVGDRVELESETSTVLGYAALVFVLPIVSALLFWWIGTLISKSDIVPYVVSLIPFIGSFVFNYFYLNKKASQKNRVCVTKILTDDTHTGENS